MPLPEVDVIQLWYVAEALLAREQALRQPAFPSELEGKVGEADIAPVAQRIFRLGGERDEKGGRWFSCRGQSSTGSRRRR